MLMINNAVIEVIKNLFINHQPYLIRLTTWGQNIEIRANKQEIQTIIEYLNQILNDDENNLFLNEEHIY